MTPKRKGKKDEKKEGRNCEQSATNLVKPAGNMRRSIAATQKGAMFAVGSIVRANFRPVGVGQRGAKPQFLPYDALVAAKKGDYTKLLMLQV